MLDRLLAVYGRHREAAWIVYGALFAGVFAGSSGGDAFLTLCAVMVAFWVGALVVVRVWRIETDKWRAILEADDAVRADR